jgi:hypothetical protein
VIGWIGHVSHHLGLLLGAIELTSSCAFVCKVGQIDCPYQGDCIVQVGCLTYLLLWENVTD